MKSNSHARVPAAPVEDAAPHVVAAGRRKSVARKSTSFDTLEKRPAVATGTDTPNTDFQLMISNIALFDLEDTGSRFDPQDPLVAIKIGDAKSETERQEDAGTNANFSEVFVFDLTEEDTAGEIVVEVVNKSIIGVRKHVGTGQAILREAVPKCGKDTMVTMELVYKSKKGEKPQGKLTMRAQLVDMRPTEGTDCCSVS